MAPSDFASLISSFRSEIARIRDDIGGSADQAENLERACHRLVGVSAPIGLRDLATKARQAQTIARRQTSGSELRLALQTLDTAVVAAIEALDNVAV